MFISRCLAFMAILMLSVGVASGREIFVDNVIGRDGDDGTTRVPIGTGSGPVYSLDRATRLAQFGDVIILAKTDRPYYGSLSLTGERHSGTEFRPFVIQGNGAVISGLRSVPSGSWQDMGADLWKLTLTRKGYYRLLRNGQSLPEYRPETGIDPLTKLEPGNWVAWHGSLYFRQDMTDPPENQNFAYSAEQTGVSLHQVRNVLITDLTLQHFRFDGIHAQGLCERVVLDSVNAFENGRAGVVLSGASTMELHGGQVARNSRHQILVFDRSKANAMDCQIEEETDAPAGK